jgi:hypothetical protein
MIPVESREMPDFSGPGQYALFVILRLASRAPELAKELRREHYQKLADRFRESPPATERDLMRIYHEWLDRDIGHAIAGDPAALLGVLDAMPAQAAASDAAGSALGHVLTRTPRQGRGHGRRWITALWSARLRPWLARSVELEARKRDANRIEADDGLLVAAAATGEIEAIGEDVILATAAHLAEIGFPRTQAEAYARAAAGRGDAEIAKALGTSPGAVRVLLFRARRRAIAAGFPPLRDRRPEGRRRRA